MESYNAILIGKGMEQKERIMESYLQGILQINLLYQIQKIRII